MWIVDKLFNLKRKFQRKSDKAGKTLILYSENGGFCHKIAVVDEMKRRKRHLIASHHHKPNAADFNLPGNDFYLD